MIDSECSKFSVGKFAATIVLVIVCLVMLTPIIFAVSIPSNHMQK